MRVDSCTDLRFRTLLALVLMIPTSVNSILYGANIKSGIFWNSTICNEDF